jgi:peptidoglycan/LPS O-acetylase OafA/YrhL
VEAAHPPARADDEAPLRVAQHESTSVPDVVAPPPQHPRFPLFDGLRAIAVLAVVLAHVPVGIELPGALAHIVPQAQIGVTIFFLISGFLLYRPFIAARGGGPGRPEVPDYAKRRFLRIFPAYWLALTVLTILPGFVGVEGGNPIPQYGLFFTLPVLGGPVCYGFGGCALSHTWSLVVELTFYAVLPLYALAVRSLTGRLAFRNWVRIEIALLAVLGAASLLFMFVLVPAGGRSPWLANTAAGSWFWFALGMGLAVGSVALERSESRPWLIRAVESNPLPFWLGAVAAFLALSLWLPVDVFTESKVQQVAHHLVFGLVAFLLLLPAVFGDRRGGLPRRILANRVLAWIGLISYGVFLWHFAIASKVGPGGADLPFLLGMIVIPLISIPIAAASYYLLERPILRLKYRSLRDLLGGGARAQNQAERDSADSTGSVAPRA